MPLRSPLSAKLVNDLAEQLQTKIISGEYPPGTRLRQEALAKIFNVSRTPIREALSQLEAKGLIIQAARRGAIVRTPSVREVRETYQIRAALEGLAAQLAAKWISDRQVEQLRQATERMAVAAQRLSSQKAETKRATGPLEKSYAKSSREWIVANGEFHKIIAEAANNASLAQLIRDLNLGYTRHIIYSSELGRDSRWTRENVEHHKAIIQALEEHDQVKARDAMTRHILEPGELVISWIENQPELQTTFQPLSPRTNVVSLPTPKSRRKRT